MLLIGSLTPEVLELSKQIKEKLKEADQYGEKGMVDEAQKALEVAEALKKLFARQEPVLDSSKYTAADVRILSSVFLSFSFTEGKL
ncbi:hypothetical protein SLE2022_057980 [Rubroshorea leprosula]